MSYYFNTIVLQLCMSFESYIKWWQFAVINKYKYITRNNHIHATPLMNELLLILRA